MKVIPISPAMGAVIEGIDLSQNVSKDLIGELRTIWLKYQMIAIRGQKLTPSLLLDIAKSFGEPDKYPFLKGLAEFPEITPVLKKETEASNFGGIRIRTPLIISVHPWRLFFMLWNYHLWAAIPCLPINT